MNRRHAGVATALLAALPLALATTAPAHADEPDPVTVALDWQATAITTVTFSPAKGLYLGFTSKAVDKAVAASLRHEQSSEAAAIARAAHDVLVEYFPADRTTLDDRLAQTLGAVPDGPAEDRGVAIRAEVADGDRDILQRRRLLALPRGPDHPPAHRADRPEGDHLAVRRPRPRHRHLSALEDGAFLSRIWGGIHFRDAMDDAFLIGHTVARQVCG